MKFIDFLQQHKRFSLATAQACGISRARVAYYLSRGEIVRLARGVYGDARGEIGSETVDFETLAICGYEFTIALFSALKFHGFTTVDPIDVWIALPQKARRPEKVLFPLRVIWLGEKSYRYGVQTIASGNVKFKVFSPAKTVADLFKFRNKFGIDVAIEALKEGWEKRYFTADELYRAAEVCRVTRVMAPYMESLLV